MKRKLLNFFILSLAIFVLNGCITIKTKEQKEAEEQVENIDKDVNNQIKEEEKQAEEMKEDINKKVEEELEENNIDIEESEEKRDDGQEETETETETYKEYRIGEEAELGNLLLKVNSAGKFNDYDSFWSPDSGRKYYFVDVTIQNKGSNNISYSKNNFIFQDKESYPYEEAFLGSNGSLIDTSGSLSEGEVVSGNIVYDVPENYNEFIFIYYQSIINLNKFLVFNIK